MLRTVLRLFAKPRAQDEPVGDWLLTDRFHAYLADSSPDNYRKLRELVTHDKAYHAASTGLEDVGMLVEYGRFSDARERLRAMTPGWLLSPKAHALAATVARHLGDQETERRETALYHRCIEGIMGTGDGTRERPYLVTHAGDDYDLIDYLGRRPGRQSLEDEAGRSLERIECEDRSEFWFDLTELHARLDEPPRLSRPSRRSRAR
jgi:hypothetical protein